MPKTNIAEQPRDEQYQCCKCLYRTREWCTRCPSCRLFNSFIVVPRGERQLDSNDPSQFATVDEDGNVVEPEDTDETDGEEETTGPRAIVAAKVKFDRHNRIKFGIRGLDDVLGGGAVIGSCIAMTGDPGVGKSTLILQACIAACDQGLRVLHIDGEEPRENVIDRARRIGASRSTLKNLHILDDAEFIEHAFDEADRVQPDVMVVNSLNTFYAHDPKGEPLDTEAGNPLQVKRISRLTFQYAHRAKVTTFLVCHVDKEGDMAGPKAVQHNVDAQFKLTKDDTFDDTGLVWMATEMHKNRFGNARIKALFKMNDIGKLDPQRVEDPTKKSK